MQCDRCRKRLPLNIDYCPYCGGLLLLAAAPVLKPYWQRAMQAATLGGITATLVMVILLTGLLWSYTGPELLPLTVSNPSPTPIPIVFDNPTPLIESIGRISLINQATDMALIHSAVAIADGQLGLQLLDLTHPLEVRQLGQYQPTTAPLKLTVADKFVYLADETYLTVMNVDPPSEPNRVGFSSYIPLGQAAQEVVELIADESFVYIATRSQGVWGIDVSNPFAPRRVGGYAFLDDVWGVAVQADRLYVANGADGLAVLDISQPDVIVLVDQLESSGIVRAVAALDSSFILMATGRQLFKIEVSQLEQATSRRGVDYGGAFGDLLDLVVVDNRVYFVATNGVGLIDLETLALLDFYQTTKTILPATIAVQTPLIYMVDWRGGLHVLQVHE